MRVVINRGIRFRGGLVFKAHRLLHHSTLGFRVLKKKEKNPLSSDLGTEEKSRSTILTLGPGESVSTPASCPLPAQARTNETQFAWGYNPV